MMPINKSYVPGSNGHLTANLQEAITGKCKDLFFILGPLFFSKNKAISTLQRGVDYSHGILEPESSLIEPR
jgi:hypothetical protein